MAVLTVLSVYTGVHHVALRACLLKDNTSLHANSHAQHWEHEEASTIKLNAEIILIKKLHAGSEEAVNLIAEVSRRTARSLPRYTRYACGCGGLG